MTRSVIPLGVLLALLWLQSCGRVPGETRDTYVVMVSFDGFRWDYTDLYDTPHFDDLASGGIRAERLIPSFPTKTFPNHYTLATGLYPDHHGIINNSFFAEELGGIYRIRDRSMVTNPDAYLGEPVWLTAEKQGILSACYYWVGSEAPIQGTYPTYWKTYDGSVPYKSRIRQVMRWLRLPVEKRPGLITLYFDEPDHTGHSSGPEHPRTGRVVADADRILGRLRKGISRLPHGDRVHLVVLSDHGMAPVDPSRYVNLNDYVPEEWTERVVGGNPVYLVDPAGGMGDSIVSRLRPVEGVQAWTAGQIPEHFHYGTSSRFPGVLVVADSLWSIGTRPDPSGYTGGAHGYDPAFTDMHALFMAEGPKFKSGYHSPSFENVEVYNILCYLLGLDPAPNDGDLDRVRHLFRD